MREQLPFIDIIEKLLSLKTDIEKKFKKKTILMVSTASASGGIFTNVYSFLSTIHSFSRIKDAVEVKRRKEAIIKSLDKEIEKKQVLTDLGLNYSMWKTGVTLDHLKLDKEIEDKILKISTRLDNNTFLKQQLMSFIRSTFSVSLFEITDHYLSQILGAEIVPAPNNCGTSILTGFSHLLPTRNKVGQRLLEIMEYMSLLVSKGTIIGTFINNNGYSELRNFLRKNGYEIVHNYHNQNSGNDLGIVAKTILFDDGYVE